MEALEKLKMLKNVLIMAQINLINYLAQKNKKICEKISHIFGAQSISIMVDYKNYNNKNYTYLESGKKISMLLKKFLFR